MKYIIFYLLLFISISTSASTHNKDEFLSEYILKIGDELFLKKSSSTIWAEDLSILKIEDRGSQIRILGLKSGSTEIRLQGKVSRIHILQKNDFLFFKNLNHDFQNFIGLRLNIQNGKINIFGRIYLLEDYKQIVKIGHRFQSRFIFSGSISEKAQGSVTKYIEEEFKKAGLQSQSLKFNNGIQIYINETDSDSERIEKICLKLGIQFYKVKKAVEVAPTVRVQITIAEVKKDKKMQWGIRWPSSYSAQVLSPGVGINELVFDAKAFEAQGYGKILASPNLLCRSGNEAEFWAGGEFPIKIFNQKVQDVVWKKYGIILKVKPLADSSGRMHIQIESEVSSIDQSQSVDGIPGMLTDKVSSYFDLNKSQTIALSGLIKNNEGKSTEGLPFLSQIPILGGLFSSQDYKENKTELVIFVKPSIYDENQGEFNQTSHLFNL